jgi:sugar O-acyltransferase (sialic acid O-acetyltransferase NeuD family)
LDVVEAINKAAPRPKWQLVGVVDDAPSAVNIGRLADRGVDYLGPVGCIPDGVRQVIAVGSPTARQGICERLRGPDSDFATLIHPSASVGSLVTIGEGSVICAGVSVGTNVALGRHCHLNPLAVVGHDAVLADFVSVNPSATISGDCIVRASVLIGAAALILQGLLIEERAVIGGAACVTRDVNADSVMIGVPARAADPGQLVGKRERVSKCL